MNKLVLLLSLVCFFCTSPVQAQGLDTPSGPVILSVTGNIQHKNSPEAALFDVSMLQKLPWKTIKTKTRWHDGVHEFSGPTGASFLKAIGVTDKDADLNVIALNDYTATVPARDFMETGLILAMKQDGKFMSIREKGPLFIIYPFDDNPDLENDAYYTRSVWQIKSIQVK